MSTDRIPVMIPWLGEEEARAASDAVLSGWVAQGPRVAAFEKAFAERVGAEHAVAVSSCTTALHLSLVALGVGPGDEVVVPSLSFIATANAVRYVGAEPVFADVDPVSGNLTPATVDQVRTPRTRAVLAVHQGGVPADVHALRAACADWDLPLVEDAACAIGSTVGGSPSVTARCWPPGPSTPARWSPPARAAWSPPTTPSGRSGCAGCASTA